MQRRDALKTGLMAAGAALTQATLSRRSAQAAEGKANFQLKYAPHFNMFRNSAGKDEIDQLKRTLSRTSNR